MPQFNWNVNFGVPICILSIIVLLQNRVQLCSLVVCIAGILGSIPARIHSTWSLYVQPKLTETIIAFWLICFCAKTNVTPPPQLTFSFYLIYFSEWKNIIGWTRQLFLARYICPVVVWQNIFVRCIEFQCFITFFIKMQPSFYKSPFLTSSVYIFCTL